MLPWLSPLPAATEVPAPRVVSYQVQCFSTGAVPPTPLAATCVLQYADGVVVVAPLCMHKGVVGQGLW